ncbi:TetR/AcrR family transcriptional regulator [Nonomuraea sp. C10]|uniref:TetR/AcrR family transcriptional regulator n=1 Tax=Nonomuraea sp. C10 TaxID=2600577 RepID=UPI0011CDC9E4|nr:TetR/AcrR family transcriptional regulator [Nonomuraea sp. C10]TXK40828.1 TetR/AcrR family transcriptional regulator [Nonomuraea sp. C10]
MAYVDPVELLWRDADSDPRQGLSVDAIVRAGIEVADAEGLSGLSMRKVAERLGFTTMSLYRHVPSRDHLVDLMRDTAIGEPPGTSAPSSRSRAGGTGTAAGEAAEGADAVPARAAERADVGAAGGWREELEACLRQGWEVRRRHPWLAEVRGTRRLPGPNAVAFYDRLLGILSGAGLTPARTVAAADLLGRFVDAEALRLVEVAAAERASGVGEEEWWGARDSLYERLSAYPVVTALWEAGAWDEPADPFEFGLARLLDAIKLLAGDETRDETCGVCGTPLPGAMTGRPRAYCSRACRQRAYRERRARR